MAVTNTDHSKVDPGDRSDVFSAPPKLVAAETSARFFENLTYKQAAQYLGISETHLRRLKTNGSIPFIQIGRSVRFRLSSIKKWVEDREAR